MVEVEKLEVFRGLALNSVRKDAAILCDAMSQVLEGGDGFQTS